MKMKSFVFLVLVLCAHAADVQEDAPAPAAEAGKGKRQAQDEFVPSLLAYRQERRQEQVAPVEENQEDDRPVSRADEDYRPGQVISLDPQELLELQPERRAPLPSTSQLQQLYNSAQPQHRQNLQPVYFLEQSGRQVSLQPSHAVIARPSYSSNGGEASVGAALSVSDSGVGASDYDQELLALLAPAPRERPLQPAPATAAPLYQQLSTQNTAPQYQQVDRYITKPSKKPTKSRPKLQAVAGPAQAPAAPQQYLIETTNAQAPQPQPVYRAAPRPLQALRYIPVPTAQSLTQQALYERPEAQGLKVVAAPKLQQVRPQLTYRLVPYPQVEAAPPQYRLVDAPARQPPQQRLPASSIERPVTYLKRFPEPEKTRALKIYEPYPLEPQPPAQQPAQAQLVGEQYYLRPVYKTSEQPRGRYELTPLGIRTADQPRVLETTRHPHSAIYVNQKVAKKVAAPQAARLEQKYEQGAREPARAEQVVLEQHGQSLEQQRAQLPPPRNNRAYTPEEFAALVAAGFAVTPVPVPPAPAPAPAPAAARAAAPAAARRHQYLPLRGDDAP